MAPSIDPQPPQPIRPRCHSRLTLVRRLVCVAIVLVLMLIGYLTFQRSSRQYSRRHAQWAYTPGPVRLKGPFSHVTYDFMEVNPFPDGRLWVMAKDATEDQFHSYRVNLETGRIEGMGEGGTPLAWDENGQLTLYATREQHRLPGAGPRNPAQKIADFAGSLFPRRMRRPDRDQVDYWLQAGPTAQPVKLGTTWEITGAGTTGRPSPCGDFYYVMTTTRDCLLVNLRQAHLTHLPPARDWQGGWWSDTEYLYPAPNGDLALLDATTGQASVMLTLLQLEQFLAGHGLSLVDPRSKAVDPKYYSLWPAWNGDHYEFFLAKNVHESGKGWLLRLDKMRRAPELLATDFPFARTGRLSGAGTHYVFSGETQTGDSNAVYLYDRTTSQTTTLVPANPAKPYFSLPNFYRDTVIYKQDGRLWQVNIDGTGRRCLFPPEDVSVEPGKP